MNKKLREIRKEIISTIKYEIKQAKKNIAVELENIESNAIQTIDLELDALDMEGEKQ